MSDPQDASITGDADWLGAVLAVPADTGVSVSAREAFKTAWRAERMKDEHPWPDFLDPAGCAAYHALSQREYDRNVVHALLSVLRNRGRDLRRNYGPGPSMTALAWRSFWRRRTKRLDNERDGVARRLP